MTRDVLVILLRENIGKRLRVTFDHGVVQSVEIDSVDEEGFLHSGPNEGDDRQGLWTRFEGVNLIEPTN